jgi:hypothetical protein
MMESFNIFFEEKIIGRVTNMVLDLTKDEFWRNKRMAENMRATREVSLSLNLMISKER